jgi:uncharacterized membrane protein YhhN
MAMVFGAMFWALAGAGVAGAVAYGLFCLNRPAGWARAAVKTLFMAAIAGALAAAHAPPPLIFAVIASAFGDFFLAFDKKWLLPFGILSFLIAQLLYVLIFTGVWFFSGDNAPLLPRYLAMGALIAAVVGYLFWFWRPDLKRSPLTGGLAVLMLFAVGVLIPWYAFFAFAVPRIIIDTAAPIDISYTVAFETWGPLLLLIGAIVLGVLRRDFGIVRLVAMIYAGTIALMGAAAMWLPWAGWPAMLGAALFVLSDLVLATELFRLPPDAPARRITAPVVWWTYAAAQVLIVWGVLQLAQAM